MKLNRTAINKIATEKRVTIIETLNDLEALNLLTNSDGVSLSKSELVSIGLSSGDAWDSVLSIDNFTPIAFEVGERTGSNGSFQVFKAIDKDGKTLNLKESQYTSMITNGKNKQYFHLISISEGRYKKEDDETPFISFKFDITTSSTSSEEMKYVPESNPFTEAELNTIKGQKSFNSGLEYLKRKSINVPKLVELGLIESIISVTFLPRLNGENVTAYKARTGNKSINAEVFKTLPLA